MPNHVAKEPSLDELQHWMRWILTDPRGVDEALDNPRPSDEELPEGVSHPSAWISRFTEPQPRCLGEISDVPALSPRARLGIYAEGYFARLRDCLAGDFPALAARLGQETFQILIAEYLVEHPSRYATVAEVGRALPGFVSSHRFCQQYPFALDLTTLEWAVTEAFLATD